MTRRCFHCSHDGHNSRTCPNRGVKLFGVRLTDGSIRKSASMGNLSLLAGSSGGASPADGPEPGGGGASADGYASEDFVKGSSASCRERKKGNPWTEEEHRRFLLGLQKLGKGDWRGISRNYVPLEPQPFLMSFQESDAQNNKPPLIPPTLNEEYESMDSNDSIIEAVVSQPEASQCSYPVILPAYFSPFLQFSFPNWSGNRSDTSEQQSHEIIKPTPVHSKTAINVDELALGQGEARPERLANLPGGALQTGAAWALARAQALGASGERLGKPRRPNQDFRSGSVLLVQSNQLNRYNPYPTLTRCRCRSRSQSRSRSRCSPLSLLANAAIIAARRCRCSQTLPLSPLAPPAARASREPSRCSPLSLAAASSFLRQQAYTVNINASLRSGERLDECLALFKSLLRLFANTTPAASLKA
ncbi:hypothetical protein C4D60_Mb05t04430 [Musa balbisiana]|uniref:Uncharacterized protein n=1 Tax=Musa balbisiana TaxID=52838 RepID=A0A4S8JTP4_MUSBA|nr:hypothetical protein C4D60_Mb05t04430 [Musa balbisiana]